MYIYIGTHAYICIYVYIMYVSFESVCQILMSITNKQNPGQIHIWIVTISLVTSKTHNFICTFMGTSPLRHTHSVEYYIVILKELTLHALS